ncbi:MAG: aminotransferase class V-fold PLP-dependent enzyme [Planctomycetota bacterium]|jgi:L-seryl-tRNA(Ser) seleniumtransferase
MSSYRELGLEPIINACGTVTRLGGAPMPQAVLDAFREAASEWVPLEQLQAAASQRIAEVTGAEAGLVTAGSAAALTLGAAAILAKHNLGRMERLPQTDGFPNEILIARDQRSGYDHAIRAAGAKLVEVGFNEVVSNAGVRRTEIWEYEAAIGPQTAGIAYVLAPGSAPPLGEVVALAKKRGLSVIVDAAGELPPRENLRRIPTSGVDLVAFSGGKAIRGPQSTGILCGRREFISSAALQMLDMDDHFELWSPPEDLIERQRLNGIPRHGIGRALKVSKEEIIALLTALDLFASGAYDADLSRFRSYLETITAALSDLPAQCRITDPSSADRWPVLEISVDESAIGCTAFEICSALRAGSPAVYVGHGKLSEGILIVNPLCLDEGSTTKLTKRLQETLRD